MADSVLQNVPFPAKLVTNANLALNWKRFKRSWENYEVASRIQQQSKEVRCATLKSCMGEEAMEIIDGLTFAADDDGKDPDKVIKAMDEFCVGETNETFERYSFFTKNQDDATIDSYVAALRSLAKTCNFDALEDSLIRDRIVIGIGDNNTRKKLLSTEKLDLKKCIAICRANETTEKISKAMGTVSIAEEPHDVSKVSVRPKKRMPDQQYQRAGSRKQRD